MQVQNKERGYSRTKEGRHEYYLKVRESQLAKSKQRYFEKKDILLEYQREYRKIIVRYLIKKLNTNV